MCDEDRHKKWVKNECDEDRHKKWVKNESDAILNEVLYDDERKKYFENIICSLIIDYEFTFPNIVNHLDQLHILFSETRDYKSWYSFFISVSQLYSGNDPHFDLLSDYEAIRDRLIIENIYYTYRMIRTTKVSHNLLELAFKNNVKYKDIDEKLLLDTTSLLNNTTDNYYTETDVKIIINEKLLD